MVLASGAPAASQVVPGILGFLVVAGMGLVLYFLLRSMNKQLRKVVPDPAWRKEVTQAKAEAEAEQQQDYTTNGTSTS
jgi:hypothetical protein